MVCDTTGRASVGGAASVATSDSAAPVRRAPLSRSSPSRKHIVCVGGILHEPLQSTQPLARLPLLFLPLEGFQRL